MDTKISAAAPGRAPIQLPYSGRRKTLYLLFFVLLSSLYSGCVHGRIVSPAGQIDAVPPSWDPVWEYVSPGVSYIKVEEKGLQPSVHLVRIELTNPHLRIVVPPPFPAGMEPEKLGRYRLLGPGISGEGSIAALWNGTPFKYRNDKSIPDSENSRIMEPAGVWISGGVAYSSQQNEYGILQKSPSGGIEITLGKEAHPEAEWAVGGYLPILRDGLNIGIHGERHARTAVGVSRDGTTLYVCVVEGQRVFLPGLTSRETAEILLSAGAWNALNLDGGNSSFLLLKRIPPGNRNPGNIEVSPGSREAGEPPAVDEWIFYRGSRERLPCIMVLVSTAYLN